MHFNLEHACTKKSASYNMQLRHRWERRGLAPQIHILRAEGGGKSTQRPGQSTPGKETHCPIAQEPGWVGVLWTSTKNLARSRVRTPVGTAVLVFIYYQYNYCIETIKTYPYHWMCNLAVLTENRYWLV